MFGELVEADGVEEVCGTEVVGEVAVKGGRETELSVYLSEVSDDCSFQGLNIFAWSEVYECIDEWCGDKSAV